MSSQTLHTTTEELKRAYNAALLQVKSGLKKAQKKELCFYYTELIPEDTTGTLNILRSLEYAGKISWEDVCFLKEGLRVIRRLDLVETLTAFEIKRDVTVLLDLYARKRQGSESSCRFTGFTLVKSVAGYLVKITTEIVGERFDISNFRSLMESRRSIKKVLVDFEEEIERELLDTRSKLTLLVVIAGEIVAEAMANEQRPRTPKLMELFSTAADELCSRMLKLGIGWVS